MPSFDFTSELDSVALKNAVDVVVRAIDNRYDFKGTAAAIEYKEKEQRLVLTGDNAFQLDQIKDLLYPALEKKEKDASKRLVAGTVEKAAGNTVRQTYEIKVGIETTLAKQIVQMIKDAKLKVQASIQGDTVRVQGAKRDDLQAAIALIQAKITDFPIKAGNFRN